MQGAYYCTRGHADDMILLAQTSHDMQCRPMLNICQAEIEALDLQFNVSKSVVMRVGPAGMLLVRSLFLDQLR